MAERHELFVGQPVKVHQNGIRSASDGEITRVGQDLVDIKVGAYQNVRTFRIADQRLNDKQYGSHSFFRTLVQEERHEREARAVKRLAAYGCRFDVGSAGRSLPVEKLERIADILEESC